MDNKERGGKKGREASSSPRRYLAALQRERDLRLAPSVTPGDADNDEVSDTDLRIAERNIRLPFLEQVLQSPETVEPDSRNFLRAYTRKEKNVYPMHDTEGSRSCPRTLPRSSPRNSIADIDL